MAPSPKYDDRIRARAAALLGASGTNGLPAVPLLIKIAKEDPFRGTRHYAVTALCELAPGSRFEEDAARFAVSRTLATAQYERGEAYQALGYFTNELARVVPVLVGGLGDFTVSRESLEALKRIGPDAMPYIRATVKARGYPAPMSIAELQKELSSGIQTGTARVAAGPPPAAIP